MKELVGNMRNYERICGKYERNMWKCVNNMKKYVDRLWYLEKFRASFPVLALKPRRAKHRAKRGGTWKNSELSIHIGCGHLFSLRDL